MKESLCNIDYVESDMSDIKQRIDFIREHVKTSYDEIEAKNDNVLLGSESLAKILLEIKERSLTLQKYADMVKSNATNIEESRAKFKSEYISKKESLVNEETCLKQKLIELRMLSTELSKKKTALTHMFITFSKQITEMAANENLIVLDETKRSIDASKINVLQTVGALGLVQDDIRHYQQLIQDAAEQEEHISELIEKHKSIIPKIKSETEHLEKLSGIMDSIHFRYESVNDMINMKTDLYDQISMLNSEILRKKEKIEKIKRKRLTILENLHKLKYDEIQHNPYFFRSHTRKQLLENEHEFLESELNKSISLIKYLQRETESQSEHESNLQVQLESITEDINNIQREGDALLGFTKNLDIALGEFNQKEMNTDVKTEELASMYKSINEMLHDGKVRLYVSNSELTSMKKPNAATSDEVISAKQLEAIKLSGLESQVSEAIEDQEKVRISCTKTRCYIEQLNAEKDQIEGDFSRITKRKEFCKTLSGVDNDDLRIQERHYYIAHYSREGHLANLAKTCVDLERARDRKSADLNRRKTQLTLRLRRTESMGEFQSYSDNSMRKTIQWAVKSNGFKDRKDTAERVINMIIDTYRVVYNQHEYWNTVAIYEDDVLDQWDVILSRIIEKTDDLITWVQVFGKYNDFRY